MLSLKIAGMQHSVWANTRIMVAYRPETISSADRVFLVVKGQIVEHERPNDG